MNHQKPIRNLVFVVATEADEIIVATLAKRLLSPAIQICTVTMATDLASFHATYILVMELLRKGHQHFFVLFDTETTNESRLAYYQNFIAEPLKQEGLLEYVTVCPVVPNINTWLLDQYQLPEKRFGQEFDLTALEKVTKTLDLTVLKRKNASFKHFAEALQQRITQPQPRILKKAA